MTLKNGQDVRITTECGYAQVFIDGVELRNIRDINLQFPLNDIVSLRVEVLPGNINCTFHNPSLELTQYCPCCESRQAIDVETAIRNQGKDNQ